MEDKLTISIVLIIALTLSAFFSGMEIAFVSSNKVRASLDINRKGFVNRLLDLFYGHTNMVISTLLVGNNIVLVIYGMAIALLLNPILEQFTDNSALKLAGETIISTLIILFVGEFLPKSLFRINPNYSLRAFSLPLAFFYYVLYPISWFTSFISGLLMRLFGVKVTSKEIKGITVGELDAYIQENIDKHEDENKEVEREVKIFHNALDFSKTHLRDCMIPRNEIVAVNIETTDREALTKRFNETGLSKIVVYSKDIDNIVGCIHVNELFHTEIDWKTHLKPVIFAPETLLANKMMRSMLAEKKSMAIVVDEFGGTSGLVTLEDLVEEIFGEIEDEHDHQRVMVRKLGDGLYDFSGRMEIDQLNEEFHLDIPEDDDYQTLAGYLLYNLETIPEVGETFKIENLNFTIIRKTASKIEVIRVEKLPEEDK